MKVSLTLDELQARLQVLLPDSYNDNSQTIQPAAMGSAALKFAPDGTVAWNEIWGSFCHLAMAGGPPHKGALLQPGTLAEIQNDPGRQHQAVAEICRGITLVTGLETAPSSTGPWVRVECASPAMAGWVTRAITVENVAVRCDEATILLPAGPHYRLEKEIKNVITVIAKTHHYWRDHFSPARRQAVAALITEMNRVHPLLRPAAVHSSALDDTNAAAVQQIADLQVTDRRYHGWLGVETHTVTAAITIMRLLLASNILSRRENTTVFLPVDPATDPTGVIIASTFAHIQKLVADQVFHSPSANLKT